MPAKQTLLHTGSFFGTLGLPSVVSLMMSDLSGGDPFESSLFRFSPQPLTSRCLCLRVSISP